MKKERSKIKMKKKLLVFIGLITIALSFMLSVPSTKAQTNTRLVVQSYNVDAGTITFYDYDTQALFGTFDFNKVYDAGHFTAIIAKKEFIPYVFRLGDVYELIDYDPPYMAVLFVRPADRQISYSLLDMVGGQVYEYKGIVDNAYIFQQGLNFYRVLMTQITVFRHDKEGEYGYQTILKPGNQYVFITDFGDVRFHFFGSPDFEYYKGFEDGRALESGQSYNAYRNGYEAGMKVAEGLLESEYQRGLQNGYASGYDDGLNKGYQNGFDDAYNEIISSDEYTLGYDNGFKAGEKSKIAQNNQSFYSNIEKWLVPAIIVVLVVGGIMSISALKRREA
jgi:hypothetical protein